MGMANEAIVHAYARGFRSHDGKIINPSGGEAAITPDKDGYGQFTVYLNKYKKKFRVRSHRFVAYEIFGDTVFREGLQVRHLDGDESNNKKDNIALGTCSENRMDMLPEVRKAVAAKAASHQRLLTNDKAQQLINDRADGMPYKELMAKYHLSKCTVSYIVNGKTYPELERP